MILSRSAQCLGGENLNVRAWLFFGDANLASDHSSVLGPVDHSLFAQTLDQAVARRDMGCGNGSGVHAEGFKYGYEV
jgi:hypothetical protein